MHGEKTQPFRRHQARRESRAVLEGLCSHGRADLSAELPCQRERPRGEQGTMPGPSPASPACPSAAWGVHAWMGDGVRPWRRMCSKQHGFSRARSGSPYGRCCSYTGTPTHGDAPQPRHRTHPVLRGTARRHRASSRHPGTSNEEQE